MSYADASDYQPHSGDEPAPIVQRFDTAIEAAIAEKRLVGAVVVAAKDGTVIYERAAGLADREEGRPMAQDAIFRLSSVSKPYVSAAAMVLVAQGKIDLDDPVEKFLPEFRPKLPNGEVATITVRHLLSHTAGLTYGFLEVAGGGSYRQLGVSDGMERTSLTLDENIANLAKAPLLYTPGTAWGYSIATDVLGALIARVCGCTLAVAVSTLVTRPLGLRDTGFVLTDETRLSAAYLNAEPEPKRMVGRETIQVFENTAGIQLEPDRAWDTAAFHSGGSGMLGTAHDFLTFLEALREGNEVLLTKDLVDEMGRVQTGNLELENWPGRGFGLGFTVLKDPVAAGSPESVGTWRLGGAYGHSWFMDPVSNLSVVAFTNTAFEGMYGQFTVDLCKAAYG